MVEETQGRPGPVVGDGQGIDETKLRAAVESLNGCLADLGLPKLDVVRPRDCAPQKVNARFMDQQTMDRLVENIKSDGHLESVPLVAERDDRGKYPIISGHHRIEAAGKAKIEWVMVMVITAADLDAVRAKQLSHNSITGRDDEVLLSKMYGELSTLQAKLYSGLQDTIASISVPSLTFRAGNFKVFSVTFLPEDIESYDAMEKMAAELPVVGSSAIRTASIEHFKKFGEAIRKVKKAENIKSNGTALGRIVELAKERLAQLTEERKLAEADGKTAEEEAEAKAAAAKGSGKKTKPGKAVAE